MAERRRADADTEEQDGGYEPLEADAADELYVADEAEALDEVDARESPLDAGDAEDAYPPASETEARDLELQEMLHEAGTRDPETLAAEEARAHSGDRYRGVPADVRRRLDRSPLEEEDIDIEELIDAEERA